MTIIMQKLRLTGDKILATELEHGMSKTAGGIIITDDVGKDHGLRPRWARILMVGPDMIDDVAVGDWVLVEHGRWSVGFDLLNEETGETVRVWQIDNKGMMIVSDTDERPTSFVYGK
jgi:co-chaperonin GroES (HSP10)